MPGYSRLGHEVPMLMGAWRGGLGILRAGGHGGEGRLDRVWGKMRGAICLQGDFGVYLGVPSGAMSLVVGSAARAEIARGLYTMKPVDIVRLAGKVDKRSLLIDLLQRADMSLVEQVLAPMWKNLDTEYVRKFILGGAGVRFVCTHRACPMDKTIEVPQGTTLAEAKENFRLGFFTSGGTPLVPFVNGERADDSYRLQGGETVEFKLP